MLGMRKAALMCLLVACSRTPPESPERRFEQAMAGVTLTGYSTRTGKAGLSGEERYMIDGVRKIGAETWLFQARMNLGDREVPVPVPMVVKWAGDTAALTLTDFTIPGMGTFTARILIYGDQYAGTWSGGKSGGQMFGRIVKRGAR